MKNRQILIIGLILVLTLASFGCTMPWDPPVVPPTNTTTNVTQNTSQNTSGNQNVTIIVTPQKNQTIEQNQTNQNQTAPPVPKRIPDYTYEPNRPMDIYFLDVGGPGLQGNAALLRKGDFTMLIDAGPVENGAKVADFLRAHEVTRLNVFVSTTQDPRNYRGIDAVAEAIPIETIWYGDITDANYQTTLTSLINRAQDTVKVERGTVRELDGIRFEILNPVTPRFGNIDNDAIVMRIDDRNFSMLMTSNIQSGARDKLMNEQLDKLKVQIMSAPYYGTGTGTSGINLFLTSTKPQLMIITGSADDSATNGGSREPFMRQLKQYGIKYNETFVSGNIAISTDGQTYDIRQIR